MSVMNSNIVNKTLNELLKSVVIEITQKYPDMNIEPELDDKSRLDILLSNWKSIPGSELDVVKQKPNEKCECKSGRKYKKCCHIKHMQDNMLRNINYELNEKQTNIVKLYNNSVRDGLKLINPDEYLQRQSVNRVLFELLEPMVNEHYLRSELENTITYKYFKYMYYNLPAWIDYVNEYFKQSDNIPQFVEIYYNLVYC